MKNEPNSPSDDTYSRVDYRRFVAWPARIERERPLLEFLLKSLPEASILDLGCGTGEHSRFFASQGNETVGVDRSAKMLESAKQGEVLENLRFLEGDISRLGDSVEGRRCSAIPSWCTTTWAWRS